MILACAPDGGETVTVANPSTVAFFTTPTEVRCFWCHHNFDTPPVSLPTAFDGVNAFKLSGVFCGWPCCSAYSCSLPDIMSAQRGLWIRKLREKIEKPLPKESRGPQAGETPEAYAARRGTRRAPHWRALKPYGGHMSIEEFRGTDAPELELQPDIIVVVPTDTTLRSNKMLMLTKTQCLSLSRRTDPASARKHFAPVKARNGLLAAAGIRIVS